ncbi:MAG: S8 family serine peptidase [Ferruginibacter sp.]
MSTQVQIKKSIYIRKGPGRSFDKIGVADPSGKILVMDGMEAGENWKGLSNWYYKINDKQEKQFYWEGGLIIGNSNDLPVSQDDVKAFLNSARFPPEMINWNNKLIKFPAQLKNNKGKGIKIAVLDTGIDATHLDLSKNIISIEDFTNADDGPKDMIGHGSAMASLIGAFGFFSDKGISGIASLSGLVSAKVMYDKNDPQDFLSVGRGIDSVVAKNVDIINMSIGRDTDVQQVKDKISNATKTIFVASAKQFSNTSPEQLLQFPSKCPEVIPVVALDKDYTTKNWDRLPAPLLIIPYFDAWSCNIKDNNYYQQEEGSSVATAIISGLIALILSDNPSVKRNKQAILSELDKYSSTIEEAFKNPGQELHFIYKK